MIVERLKYTRERKNIKQRELASLFGVDYSTVSGWETGKDTIPLKYLIIYANTYNYSLDYLYGLTTENKQYEKLEIDLEKMSFSNDFDILIKTNTSIYATSKDFISSLTDVEYNRRRLLNENILYDEDNVEIKRKIDKKTGLSFILFSSLTMNLSNSPLNGPLLAFDAALVEFGTKLNISLKYSLLSSISFVVPSFKTTFGNCFSFAILFITSLFKLYI